MNDLPEKNSADSYVIEVIPKRGVKDTLALDVAGSLKHLHIHSSPRVTTAKLYRLNGDLSPDDRQRIGRELLSDPVVEEAHEDSPAAPKKAAKSVIVDVWFKPGVTDVVGESVLKGLRDMQMNQVNDVRTGTRYRFWGLKHLKTADKLALALLMNPLIHERSIYAD